MLEMKIYKNWRELCKELGWDTKGGNYKKAKLKELDTLCKYHKDGNKIVIDKVFEVAKDKVDFRANNGGHSTKSTREDDGRKNKNAIYKELDNIILDYLYCYTFNDTVNITKNQLIKRCGFIISNIQETDEYNKETINDVLDVYKSILTHAVDSSLKRLKKRGFIDYCDSLMIKKNGVLRLATYEEEKEIKEIEKQVKEEMKIKNVFLLDEQMQMSYYDRCSYLCYEKEICSLYYKVININKIANFDIKEMILTDNKNKQLSLKTIDRQSFISVVIKSLKKSKVFENNIKKAKEVDLLSANDRIKNRINLTYDDEVKSVIEKIKIMLC